MAIDRNLQVFDMRKVAVPWTLALGILAVVVYAFLGAAPEAWVFDRIAVENGEFWRLITAHWVHSDIYHLLWNFAALVLLGLLFEQRLRSFLLVSLLVGSVSVDTWLWWGNDTPEYYCGLSGILNCLLVVGLFRFWQDHKDPLVIVIALGAVAKIVIEMISGQALFTHTIWASVPTAHASGFLGGLVLVLVLKVYSAVVKPHQLKIIANFKEY